MRDEARRGLIERLEEAPAESATVDDRAAQREQRRDAAVNPAAPPRVAQGVEAIGMPEVEQRLGLAVPALLPDVGFHGVAPEVPHHGRGAEPDAVAVILKSPAKIDVVTGGAENGVESADLLEYVTAKRHVAAGDVLGVIVVQQHVLWPAGRGRHAGGDERILRWRQGGAPDRRQPRVEESHHEAVEAVGISAAIPIV